MGHGSALGLVLPVCRVGGFVGGFRCQQSQASAAKPCENAQSTAEMLDCWDNQYKKADAELNKVYKEIMSRLGDKEKVKLRDAQRAWIPYKEKKGEAAAAQDEGGTLAPVSQPMALTEETQNRVAELKKTYRDVLPDEVLTTPQPEAKPSTPTPPPVQPPVNTLIDCLKSRSLRNLNLHLRIQHPFLQVPPLQSHPQPPRLAQR